MATPTPRHPTILVVDDEASVRLALRILLEGAGYAVAEARTGQEALEACARDEFALVVADVVMPDVDGLEVLRTLRRTHPTLPVVLLTGREVLPWGDLAAIAAHLGARRVFLKPMASREFLDAVRLLVPPAGPAGEGPPP
jgi:CheY-like chemotaxis protein